MGNMALTAKTEVALICSGEMDQALTCRTDRISSCICRSACHRRSREHRIVVSNKNGFERLFPVLCVMALLMLAASAFAQSPSQESHRTKVMIVGISHLVAKQDLHNFDLGDPMSPKMQTQIADVMQHLLSFHPTKVRVHGMTVVTRMWPTSSGWKWVCSILGNLEYDLISISLSVLSVAANTEPVFRPHRDSFETSGARPLRSHEHYIEDREGANGT